MTPLHQLSIRETATLIESRQLSPVALVQHYLDRIKALDHAFVSYLHVDTAGALQAAHEADAEIAAGSYRGPLHGIPFAVKDNYAAAGLPMTAGSAVMADHVASEDAGAIARLKDAGAILLGKLNTWEYGTGSGSISFDLPTPPARNPWSSAHFTGGSSSGSGAALAGGLAAFTLGSDTGGSVRLPAAACGLYGLKPTLGRVSRRGIQHNCYAFDTAGPLAHSAEDCALLLDAMAGHDPQDAVSVDAPVDAYAAAIRDGVKGLRVGVVGLDDMQLEPCVRDALRAAADALVQAGAIVAPAEMPLRPSDYRKVSMVINWSESFAIHQQDFLHREHLMGHALREKMIKGRAISAVTYVDAQRQRRLLTDATDAMFAEFDLLLMAMTATRAPAIDNDAVVKAFTSDAASHAFSLTGHPAIAIPSGVVDGLPVSVQLGAGYFDEKRLLAGAYVLQQAFGVLQRDESGDASLPNMRNIPKQATPRRDVAVIEAEVREALAEMPVPMDEDLEPGAVWLAPVRSPRA
jgi:aspartyl-tRNA(Asn)/glutamyl-tRNA(Gln) amidotransferase subunit A